MHSNRIKQKNASWEDHNKHKHLGSGQIEITEVKPPVPVPPSPTMTSLKLGQLSGVSCPGKAFKKKNTNRATLSTGRHGSINAWIRLWTEKDTTGCKLIQGQENNIWRFLRFEVRENQVQDKWQPPNHTRQPQNWRTIRVAYERNGKKKKKNSITIAISAHHKTEIQAQSSYCLQSCRVDNIRTDYNGSKHMRYKQNCCPLITTSDSIKPADQQTSVKTYTRKLKNSRGDNQRATSYYYHQQNSIVSVISTLQKPVKEAEAEN